MKLKQRVVQLTRKKYGDPLGTCTFLAWTNDNEKVIIGDIHPSALFSKTHYEFQSHIQVIDAIDALKMIRGRS